MYLLEGSTNLVTWSTFLPGPLWIGAVVPPAMVAGGTTVMSGPYWGARYFRAVAANVATTPALQTITVTAGP
jgi:hypothetical protein